jgi:hypothetical protein
MPFQGPHPYIDEIKNGATVELDGRVIGHLEGVVPQVDGLHVFRLIASVDIPFTTPCLPACRVDPVVDS